MPLHIAVSTSYKAGEVAALVGLAVLLALLCRRMVNRRGQPLPKIDAGVWVAPPVATSNPGSVAPPGWEAPTPPPRAASLAAPMPPRDTRRRAQITDAAAAVLLAALIVFGGLRIAQQGAPTSPWASGTGRDLKAGFMSACAQRASAIVDCECAFDHLTAQPPYNTPAGLETLGPRVLEYVRTRGASGLPAVYMTAFMACRHQSSGTAPASAASGSNPPAD